MVANTQLVSLRPLLDWPADGVVKGIDISRSMSLPACEVEAFDEAQTNPLAMCVRLGNAGVMACD